MAKVIFMGTPDFAVPTLKALIAHHDVIGVVTQPDRPAGRGGKVRQSPVKQLALDNDIRVYQPERLRRKKAIQMLLDWQTEIPDVYVVAAFGQILPQKVLDIPKHGSINIHGSLLPRWRGAAPIHAAIRAGDEETGITIMQMDAGLDTGDMLSKQAIPILSTDTGQTVHDKLSQLGADLLIETLPGYLSGDVQPQAQNDDESTYAPQIDKSEGQIDWSQDAATIERLVRAFTPWPGTYTFWDDTQLKIHSGTIGGGNAEPGKVIEYNGVIAIGTGDGLYLPQVVQLAGKKRMTTTDFVNGYQDFVGAILNNGTD
ncbi:MAG: methionyl-tRNA formyltransferase [Aggregatilineales bacterium]